MKDRDELRAALEKLIDILSRDDDEADGEDRNHDGGGDGEAPDDMPGCSIRSLPQRLWKRAAAKAVEINPVNAPSFALFGAAAPLDPLQIAVMTAKYWGPAARRLTVSFMESTPSDLRRRILQHMNAWNTSCGISFVETSGSGDVRISRAGSGYWSYLGTDVKLIPRDRPTMNLQAFSMSTRESEYKRVVRHETGHTLGFPHEHMRKALVDLLDREKTFAYFLRTQGWDRAMVQAQVLTPLSEASIMGTPVDQTSIMCYQLPGEITKSGRPIAGGIDINATDYAFAAKIYPKSNSAPANKPARQAAAAPQEDDWPESDDVED